MPAFLKTTNGGLLSNKPPKDPVASASSKAVLTFTDGRKIGRSNPRPDRIAIVGYLLPHHFKGPLGGPSLAGAAWSLAESLYEATGNGDGTSKHLNPHGAKMGVFTMALGPRDTIVHVELLKTKMKGEPIPVFRLRLEFNPRKLCPGGHQMLCWTFEMVDPPFNFAAFLADAAVTRYDVAVDFVGLRPSEVLATTKTPGKTVLSIGGDGTLESFQLHRRKKLPKQPQKTVRGPNGPLALKVYDRDRERAAHGKPPPCAERPTLRAETVRTRFEPGFGLLNMFHATPFQGVGLSYLPTCRPLLDKKRWSAYCAVRSVLGHPEAASLLGLAPSEVGAVEVAFAKHPNTLLSSVGVADWQHGIAETGLGSLIELAATGGISNAAPVAWATVHPQHLPEAVL